MASASALPTVRALAGTSGEKKANATAQAKARGSGAGSAAGEAALWVEGRAPRRAPAKAVQLGPSTASWTAKASAQQLETATAEATASWTAKASAQQLETTTAKAMVMPSEQDLAETSASRLDSSMAGKWA